MTLKPFPYRLFGEIQVPGDKSISHRAVILGSISKGVTRVTNFLDGEDCMRTINAFRAMGVEIDKQGSTVKINGKGIEGLQEPSDVLYFGNSGTTTRLMLGILSGLPFFSNISGDDSLSKRPMDRVIIPLKEMGATIDGRNNGNLLPLAVRGGTLAGLDYTLPVKSAQVKSAIILAGLLAEGVTRVTEIAQTRDHTENMLEAFGADIERDGLTTTITNNANLQATDVQVPGDISSAAFFLSAAAIIPDSEITLKNVGLNPTRTGILDVLKAMKANLEISNIRTVSGESIGDITIKSSTLKATTIEGDIVPRLIDEIPIIALLATQAEGVTVIKDAEELKVKETDRIEAVVDVLSTLGARIKATDDGMIIHGKKPLNGGQVSSYHDHRIAMMAAIASLIASNDVTIDDVDSISVSYPSFFEHLNSIKGPA
ncbi:3-phosphoshikimate 1-carboxyvinyltransferase [Oceanobacillus piezotolerans]|uniref:3-phosphoshikimate 1-carboxyvinyltransferase n=1 Tax=Oceanobacillus piezotolerans TaxID=2448030 RepID=A0A498DBM4_9BACI|nr:3-phosphoshikimate 1-carboxyvinyltransferase [Oceanobacillus piezotolerans]RLL48534.1 3-phosphoshikimate 1-carboxyvinyltransferase [Oceanobacillus piezotolerans]